MKILICLLLVIIFVSGWYYQYNSAEIQLNKLYIEYKIKIESYRTYVKTTFLTDEDQYMASTSQIKEMIIAHNLLLEATNALQNFTEQLEGRIRS